MKLPGQPPQYNQSFEQQRSGIIERALGLTKTTQTVELIDGVDAPGPAVGKALLYVDAADGDLKVVFSDGTVKTIATDT
jgi:hypothetical protein